MKRWYGRNLVAAAALVALAGPAASHHGWSWTVDELSTLEGVIRAVELGNPHAALDVESGAEMWRVELAPPSATTRAGFTADVAKPGDRVTALGNRSLDPAERRMKAVRLTIGGKTFDIYPSRIPSN